MRTYSHLRTSALRFFRITYNKSGIFLSCLFAGLSLTLLIERQLINNSASLEVMILVGIFTFCSVVAFSMLISYIVGYYTLSPEKFSKAMISGRMTTEALQYLAKNIAKVCSQSATITETTITLLKELDHCINANHAAAPLDTLTKVHGKWIAMNGQHQGKLVLLQLQNLKGSQSRRLKRIDAMKSIFAEEHKITQRKLANHILDFSLSIYKDRFDKQTSDWLELIKIFEDERIKDLKGVESKEVLRRVRGLVYQLLSIHRVMNGRYRRQKQLMRFDFLCNFCIEIANERSSTSGINLYAQTLSKISELALAKLHGIWWNRTMDKLIKDVEELLEFVFRKQRAYSGYDLHELLVSLVGHIVEDSRHEDSQRKLLIIEEILTGVLAKGDKKPVKGGLFFYKDGVLDLPDTLDQKKEIMTWKLNFLADLSVLTSFHLTADQSKVMSIYKYVILPKYFDGKPGNRYIVTHGYSKITRQILKHALPDNDKKKNIIYILSDDTFNEDARLLKYELKSETRKSDQMFGSIAIGGIDNLQAQYDPEKDSMILILGADCYDKEGRILFHRSLKELLQNNVFISPEYRKRKNILVSIAVESYKLLNRPLTESVAYDDHLDQVQIFNSDMIDLIIDETVKNDEDRKQAVVDIIASFKRNDIGPLDGNRLAS